MMEMRVQAAYEHNGQPVEREAFYAIACDPARSVAVEACAGAGKTWMLVSRILRALLEGCEPHEILAITFTKKAAGEMRQRLLEWLEAFSRTPLPALRGELQARGIPAEQATEEACARLQGLFLQVLGAGRPVQIRTFHSWFAALLGTAPLAVLQSRGLPLHYELLEDDAEAVRRVWPLFLQQVAADAGLGGDFADSVSLHGRSQTRKALESALSKRVEFELAEEGGVVDASVPPFHAQSPQWAGLEHPAQALAAEDCRARWLAWAAALGSESGKTPQKAADAIVTAFCDTTDLQARLEVLRGALFVAREDRLTRHLEKFAAAQEAERELQALCLARRQHEAWLHQQRMARLTRALVAAFGALKRDRGWVDMNDVERTALVMLSDPVLSGWVQERLDARVRHLLIDEFQDTNPLQWQALHAWLASYVGTGGGQHPPSVFIVGDPKQSIYRFRRAEPQVFRAAQAFVRQGLGGDLLACDHTRRNAPEVIAAVNAVMGAAQAQGDYAGFRDHTTESRDAGVLLRLPPIEDAADEGGNGEAGPDARPDPLAWRDSLVQPRHEAEETLRMRECQQAARWVAGQIAAGVPARQIMVLARKRDRLSALQDALRDLHLPCVQPEKVELCEAPEVQDVVALLDVLVSPGHDLSLARALRSPLFGMDDALLVRVAVARRDAERGAARGLQEGGVPGWLELLADRALLDAEMPGLSHDLRLYRHWVEQWPPHDALDAIYRHRDVLARYAAASPAPLRSGVLANLRALLSAALQQDGGRYLTPYAFVRALKRPGQRAPGRVDADAVRLLTIHGAKGLEADAVLLLDTDGRAQKAETMGVLVDWPGELPAPRRFVFLASEASPPPSVADALAAEQAERQREEINTLYVAMTRARHCLALSCVRASQSAPGSWWNRVAPLAADVPQDLSGPAGGAEDGPGAVVDAQLPELPGWQDAPPLPMGPPPGAEAEAGAQAEAGAAVAGLPRERRAPSTPASRQGEAMHQLLEQAGLAGTLPGGAAGSSAGWPRARLMQLARDFELPPELAERAAVMAARILQGEGAWAWNSADIQLAMDEAPIVHRGQTLRIDRLVRRSTGGRGEWWVLDYKSAANPERQAELVEQMRRYRQAVQGQFPGEPVRAAFLTGDGRMVEVDSSAQGVPVPAQPLPSPTPAAGPSPAAAAPPSPGPKPVQGSLFD
ncbi:DNA helicase UvrD [Paracidovorax avenae]|uniref:UvrD-helicase domain-containing protein n=1 Tax=Paracidovorax avenae TaxID=80867 RepID=UPI000D174B7E|nr:UvrD-helicase domain-containing protein [Paracidovorax avenae]AVS70836.1 DNA helicase UvrD [Paracidovorax avenae]